MTDPRFTCGNLELKETLEQGPIKCLDVFMEGMVNL